MNLEILDKVNEKFVDFNNYINELNLAGEINYSVYSDLYDFSKKLAYEEYQQGVADGIDKLAEALISKFTEYDKKGYNDHTNAGIKMKVCEIAEQLKEQKNDSN